MVPFAPPAQFFAMPKVVFPGAVLDEDFPAVVAAGAGGPEFRTHLCSLATDGTPRCQARK